MRAPRGRPWRSKGRMLLLLLSLSCARGAAGMGFLSRRRVLTDARDALALVAGSVVSAQAVVKLQGPIHRRLNSEDDEVLGRSLLELNADFRVQQRAWKAGRAATLEESRGAASRLLAIREAILECAGRCADREWDAVAAALRSAPLDALSVEVTFDTLMHSEEISEEGLREIGWGWGMCGWRLGCGSAADVEEALAELRARNGMLLPREAIFCLDVALRGVDSALAVCQAARLVDVQIRSRRESLASMIAESLEGVDDGAEDDWAAQNPELAAELDELLSNEEALDDYLELDAEVGGTIV